MSANVQRNSNPNGKHKVRLRSCTPRTKPSSWGPRISIARPIKREHPKPTGNGRVGHLLITLFLLERQILPAPLLYLSAFFEASRRDYYETLRGISERGAWNDWLEYFLLGVARTSEDALSRAARINQMLIQWQKKVAGESTNTPLRVIELLAANPFLTIKGTAEKLGVAFTTAQRAITRLERLGILKPVSQAKRDRVYCARNLLDILEEPAKLRP